MSGFGEISRMNLADLERKGPSQNTEVEEELDAVQEETEEVVETENTEETTAESTAVEVAEETATEISATETIETTEAPKEPEHLPEPEGKHFYVDTKITAKEMQAFLFGHNYRQPLMVIATIIGVCWPIAMLLQNKGDMWIAVLCIALFVLVLPLNTWNKGRMTVNKNPIYKNTFHYMLDEVGLHLELAGETVDVEWKRVYKVMFLKSVLVIYTGKLNAYLIPTASMGEQKEEIHEFVKKHVK